MIPHDHVGQMSCVQVACGQSDERCSLPSSFRMRHIPQGCGVVMIPRLVSHILSEVRSASKQLLIA